MLSSCSINLPHFPRLKHFTPTPCFVNRVHTKPPVFREGTLVPSFVYTYSFSLEQLLIAPFKLSRGSSSFWKLRVQGLRPIIKRKCTTAYRKGATRVPSVGGLAPTRWTKHGVRRKIFITSATIVSWFSSCSAYSALFKHLLRGELPFWLWALANKFATFWNLIEKRRSRFFSVVCIRHRPPSHPSRLTHL